MSRIVVRMSVTYWTDEGLNSKWFRDNEFNEDIQLEIVPVSTSWVDVKLYKPLSSSVRNFPFEFNSDDVNSHNSPAYPVLQVHVDVHWLSSILHILTGRPVLEEMNEHFPFLLQLFAQLLDGTTHWVPTHWEKVPQSASTAQVPPE